MRPHELEMGFQIGQTARIFLVLFLLRMVAIPHKALINNAMNHRISVMDNSGFLSGEQVAKAGKQLAIFLFQLFGPG